MHHIDRFPSMADRPVDLGPEPLIHPSARIVDSHLGRYVEIGERVTICASQIDDYSYVAGCDGDIINSEIGKFCSIASHVRINPGNHPMDRPTQHHCTYRAARYGFADRDEESFFEWRRSHPCRIGHDTWIGHGALIMPGVQIGIGCVIGAAAVVTHDVPDYAIVTGVPATTRRFRFEKPTRRRLLASGWWDWDHETLRQRINDLRDLESFLNRWA